MATRSKSESGTSMSKYDVEVEARLQALEEKVSTQSGGGGSDQERLASLEAKLDDLISRLSKKMTF